MDKLEWLELAEHANDEANILYGLKTAYGIICKALGEEW